MEQRSEEWHQKRLGAFTASRMAALMARTKSGPSASRANMIADLVTERLTGESAEVYVNAAMQRGTDLEEEGLNAYAFEMGTAVETIGYVDHPTLPMVGCSPDGLIGDDGLIELKCPASKAKHQTALLKGTHAKEYKWQVQHQLFVTGREWVDVVSYDPRWPPTLQLAIKRVFVDAEAHEQLHEEITKAEAEISTLVEQLRELGNMKEAAA